jgi:quinol monooxygenase YgiN
MVHVLADIKLHPGKRGEFLAEFRKLMPQVHAEQGCIEYGPAVDLPTDIPAQHPAGENVVVIVEKWASLEALKAHLAAPHMAAYRERVKAYVAGVQLYILQPA